MEVIRSSHHTAFPMTDSSRVGEVRRHAAGLADQAGLGDTEAGRLAIIVSELATNLVRHAQQGQLLLAVRPQAGLVEVVAIDRGPGIADVPRCMADGFSTGGTLGTGLGAVRRLATEFDLHSAVPGGTVAVARVARARSMPVPPAGIMIAGLSVPVHGESVCGDAWGATVSGPAVTLVVADGLGHGPQACEAATAALGTLAEGAERPPDQMVEAIHRRLQGTRGAAVTVLHADAGRGQLRACGAGNVAVRVLSGLQDRSLALQHGTAGLHIRRPAAVDLAWPDHALVVVHTDGLVSRWEATALLPVLGKDPAIAAAILLRDFSRGRDDATVAVLRRAR